MDDELREQIRDFVGDQVVEFGDLYEWAEEHSDLIAVAARRDLAPDQYLEELIDDDPRLFDTGGALLRLDLLLDSLVFTHRLTAGEVERSVLFTHPDLPVIDWDGIETFQTPAGTVTNPVRDLALDGPEGWLGEFSPGDVVSIRRRLGVLSVEHAPASLDTEPALAIRSAFDASLAVDGDPVQELGEVLLLAVEMTPTLFRTPVAPLSELIAAAGLATQGEWIAEAGTDFSSTGPVLMEERLEHTVRRWDLDACCRERLEWLLEVIGSKDADDPRSIVDSMGHEVVVLGLRDMLQGSDELESTDLGAWLDVVVEAVGRRAAPALTLRAFAGEVIGDVLGAEADLEQAHAYDPDFGPASIELATYLTMRGEYGRAAAILNSVGSDGSAIADLFAGVHLSADGVGRNDPCPCGSGRKYKACHLGKPITTPEAVADTLLLKLRMFVTDLWRGASGLPVLAFLASEGDPQAVGAMYNDDFLQSLSVFEGAGVDLFLGRLGALLPAEELELARSWSGQKLGVYEVSTIGSGDSVSIRDLASDGEITLEDRVLADRSEPGDKILTWIVPIATGRRIAPPVLTLEDSVLSEVLDLVRSEDLGATEWAAWYGSLRERDASD